MEKIKVTVDGIERFFKVPEGVQIFLTDQNTIYGVVEAQGALWSAEWSAVNGTLLTSTAQGLTQPFHLEPISHRFKKGDYVRLKTHPDIRFKVEYSNKDVCGANRTSKYPENRVEYTHQELEYVQ